MNNTFDESGFYQIITWSFRNLGSGASTNVGDAFRRLMSTSRMTSGWFEAEISSKTSRLSKRAKFFSKSNSSLKSSRYISDPKQSSSRLASRSRLELGGRWDDCNGDWKVAASEKPFLGEDLFGLSSYCAENDLV